MITFLPIVLFCNLRTLRCSSGPESGKRCCPIQEKVLCQCQQCQGIPSSLKLKPGVREKTGQIKTVEFTLFFDKLEFLSVLTK